jgi:hypothetical protein
MIDKDNNLSTSSMTHEQQKKKLVNGCSRYDKSEITMCNTETDKSAVSGSEIDPLDTGFYHQDNTISAFTHNPNSYVKPRLGHSRI